MREGRGGEGRGGERTQLDRAGTGEEGKGRGKEWSREGEGEHRSGGSQIQLTVKSGGRAGYCIWFDISMMNLESYKFQPDALPMKKQLSDEHAFDRRGRETVASISARIERLMNEEAVQEEERVVLPVLRSQKRAPVRRVGRYQPERVSYQDIAADVNS
eukprot:616233-Hanusia_phi.AAC.1